MRKERFDVRQATMEAFTLAPFLVVVKDPSKVSGVNVITVSYVSVACEDPPVIGLAVRPARHSFQLLLDSQEFTLNLPTPEMLADLDFCGSHSGRKFDKAVERRLALEPGQKISTPMLAGCPINLECEIQNFHTFGPKASHELILADVVGFQRAIGFRIEEQSWIVTTNYDYRLVGKTLGRAFKVWNKDMAERKVK